MGEIENGHTEFGLKIYLLLQCNVQKRRLNIKDSLISDLSEQVSVE